MSHLTDEALDPYTALVAAIVARAVADAQGLTSPDCAQPRDDLQAEARSWLADERALRALVELAGLDSTATVQRVRARLWHTWEPQQRGLFGEQTIGERVAQSPLLPEADMSGH